MDEVKEIPNTIGIDTEKGRVHFDPERLQLKKIEQIFVDEFSYLKPDIKTVLSGLSQNFEYVSFIKKMDKDLEGETAHFFKDPIDNLIKKQVTVKVSSSPKQDRHKTIHEYIHGLNIGDLGRQWEEDGVKKRALYGRTGPIRYMGEMTIDQHGKESFDEYIYTDTPLAEFRLWEGLTEWRARKISLKYFPQDFSNFNTDFESGYEAAYLINQLESYAQTKGKGLDFLQAVDQGLVLGDSSQIKTLLDQLFPYKNAYTELISTLAQEMVQEENLAEGQITPNQFLNAVHTRLYPQLMLKLTT